MVRRVSVGVLIILILLGMSSSPAHSRKFVPILFNFGGEKMVKVADFPDTGYYKSQDEHYFDAGIIYKQIAVFGLSLWVYDIRWCGYVDEEIYIPMSTVELSRYARAARVDLPVSPPVPFWDEWGGRLVVAGLILGAGLVVVLFGRRKENEHDL